MQIVAALFGALNYIVCLAALVVFFREYRKVKKKELPFLEVSEAYEFVWHSMFMLWWFVGTCLVRILDLNPLWVLAWLFVGLLITGLVRHLMDVSGLIGFMAAGELYLKTVAREAASRLGHDELSE